MRDLAAVVRVVDDEVGIAAHGDRALAREETEQSRGLGARAIDEGAQVDPSLGDAVCVEQVDAVFERRDAVGDLGEIATPHFLLALEIKRRVVGPDGGDEPLP